MGLAEFYGDALANADAEKLLDQALERGITFFDTADMYGSGRNEEQLSGFLKRRRKDVVIATKFAIQRNADGSVAGLSNDPAYIRQACDASLKRLGSMSSTFTTCTDAIPPCPSRIWSARWRAL